jgi:hypothetical protein
MDKEFGEMLKLSLSKLYEVMTEKNPLLFSWKNKGWYEKINSAITSSIRKQPHLAFKRSEAK